MKVHVTKDNCNQKTDELIYIDSFKMSGYAEPTSRVLDGSDDHGWDEEWTQPCTLADGRKGVVVYLFSNDETIDSEGEPLEAENYPWDDDHIRRIRLID